MGPTATACAPPSSTCGDRAAVGLRRRAAAAEWIGDRLAELGCRARVEGSAPRRLLFAAGAAPRSPRRPGARRARGCRPLAGGAPRRPGSPTTSAAGRTCSAARCPPTGRRSTSWPRRATRAPSARSCSSPTTTPRAAGSSSPGLMTRVADAFPGWYDAQETSPQMMRASPPGPPLVALGALAGARRCGGRHGARARLGARLRRHRARARRARRQRQPRRRRRAARAGARAARRPARAACACCSSPRARRSPSWRACAGSRPPRRLAAARAHARRRARVVGSPELILLEGEGMLRMHDYAARLKDAGWPLRARGAASRCAAGCAPASPRTRWSPLKAGYATGALAAVDAYKLAGQLPLAARHRREPRPRHRGRRCARAAARRVRSLRRPQPAPAPA